MNNDVKLMTINEYAQTKGVSTQAVYKQIKVHELELVGHILSQGGKRWLSPEAVEILDRASKMSAPVIIDSIDKTKLEDAESHIRELETQLLAAQIELLKAKDTIINLQTDKMEYMGITERSKVLLEQKEQELKNSKERSLWKRIFNQN